ncbi:alpha-amylase family protein [Leptolyngbya sp. PL-A3]|uniref:alpha-amylase n=1 Tax=Leptolyngbya sp. FACHB-8 TaxID=2692814 RepID=UPI0032206449
MSLLITVMTLAGSCSLGQVNLGTKHFFRGATPAGLSADPSPRTVLVHLFEWRWDDIAQECETFLGPNGYAAVQISPPQEHVVLADEQFPWWQRYQPVSYKLVSRSGDRTQLADMVRRCHGAGVQVYADAVINHMAGVSSGVGSAGTRFTKYDYPGLYRDPDFNSCRRNIDTYQDSDTVTQCELVGLADLNLASPYVQSQISAYLLDLINLGIDGFRIDAAKHIRAKELGIVLEHLREQVEPDPYVYQEVIDPGTEAIKKVEYYPNGDVFEFEYGHIVGESFLGLNNRNLAQLETLGESWGLMPADKAVVFIDNHDKQRGHGGGGTYLTHKQASLYSLANVFMLAFPYGYPQVMSSYPFTTSDQGPPADPDGTTHRIFANGTTTCGQEWVCEHHWTTIAPMVRFRNRTDGQPLTHWWTNGSNQIAFGRGDRGFVVINRDGRPLTHRFQTGLPAGEYCNLLAESCTERLRVGRDGQFEARLPGMGAIALVR